MSSKNKQVFEAIRSSDWQNVRTILSANTLTPAELEEKHGVNEVFPVLVSKTTNECE